jgi:hypothetical protein
MPTRQRTSTQCTPLHMYRECIPYTRLCGRLSSEQGECSKVPWSRAAGGHDGEPEGGSQLDFEERDVTRRMVHIGAIAQSGPVFSLDERQQDQEHH